MCAVSGALRGVHVVAAHPSCTFTSDTSQPFPHHLVAEERAGEHCQSVMLRLPLASQARLRHQRANPAVWQRSTSTRGSITRVHLHDLRPRAWL